MVLELPVGGVVVIENQLTGQLITVSIAGAAGFGKQFVAVGLPAGYRIRVEEAGCTPGDTSFLPAPTITTRSLTSTIHQTALSGSQGQ